MANIIVKITIPDHEYLKWEEYHRDGLAVVKKNLKEDIQDSLEFIDNFKIEVTHED